jgi:hypothetical protein
MIRVLIFQTFILACALPAIAEPIFPNSVVSNNLEFIKSTDASVFSCIEYSGKQRAEMPDTRSEKLFVDDVYTFSAKFSDGVSLGIWAHPDFNTRENANESALAVARALGKIPTKMRSRLSHVVIHKGDETAFAEAEGNFFVLYSENIKERLSTHDLEETIFHESVHATLDSKYLNSRAWKKAQRGDGAFVTRYAANNPRKEDMAESALFAWALIRHPGRLPKSVEDQVRSLMPHRISFFEDLFLKAPQFHTVGTNQGC